MIEREREREREKERERERERGWERKEETMGMSGRNNQRYYPLLLLIK